MKLLTTNKTHLFILDQCTFDERSTPSSRILAYFHHVTQGYDLVVGLRVVSMAYECLQTINILEGEDGTYKS